MNRLLWPNAKSARFSCVPNQQIKRKDCGKTRKSMEIREKFDGVITAGMFKVKELLLRRNFWRNSVSNIAERSGR
jgi:hypothetical protein